MSKDDPDPPAPFVVQSPAVASTQATYNEEAAKKQRALNMIWQEGPEGSLSYQPTGTETEGIQDFKAVTSLSPENQRLFDQRKRIQGQFGDTAEEQLSGVQSTLSQPFQSSAHGVLPNTPDLSTLGPAPVADEAQRRRYADAIIARNMPQLDRRREQLETQLVNQGHVRGSQGFDQSLDEFNRAENDFLLATDSQSGTEMARMHALANADRSRNIAEMGQQYTYDSNAYDRAVADALRDRQMPLSELSSLVTMSAPGAPTFLPTPQGSIAPPDYLSAAYSSANQQNQANQFNFAAQLANDISKRKGLYGLGGTVGGAVADKATYSSADGFGWG